MYLHSQIRRDDEKYWKFFGVLFADIRNICKFATEKQRNANIMHALNNMFWWWRCSRFQKS